MSWIFARGLTRLVCVPRAGRSDLIEALRRVLDPDSTRTPPGEFDVHRPSAADADESAPDVEDGAGEDDLAAADEAEDDGPVVYRAEVEVVVADLG